jgi:hypothetical protein
MSHSSQSTAYDVLTIDSWEQFCDTVAGPNYRSWAFRGLADANWQLYSALSRYLRAHGVHRDAWVQQEKRILRVFRRKAHIYLDHIPDEKDSFEWLALMRHHGAPTRLLDFTWSPYVAAYFALESATADAAIWALNPPNVSRRDEQTIRGGTVIKPSKMKARVKGNYERYYLPGAIPFVTIGEPHVMNRRLIAQSGTFATPGVLDEPLEDIVRDYPDPRTTIVKFVLKTDSLRRKAMRQLYYMNITHATLFPDLDGLARSMAYELEFHWAFDPYSMDAMPGFTPRGSSS